MRTPLLLLFILFFIPVAATAGITVTAFCPDPYLPYDPDEFIVLTGEGSLDGWTITDGEGTLGFPQGSRINGDLVLARQAEAYWTTHGVYPDFEWEYSTDTVPNLIHTDNFILANTEDEIELYHHGTRRFEIAWPRDLQPREGQIHRIVDGIWNPRPFMIGQSDFSPIQFEGVSATLFVSPDSAYEVIEQAISSAERSIEVSVYEFTHPGIGELLIEAQNRGVSVRILLEGSPVGGVSPEQAALLSVLNQSGISVDYMGVSGGERSRYRFLHSKYLIIDSESLLLTSENLKESGIPLPGYAGNRGWGVWIHDARLADYFGMVYSEDSIGSDVVPISPMRNADIPASGTSDAHTQRYSPLFIEGVTIIPVLSPDTSHLVPEMIAGATRTVEIQQAYISNWTKNAPNPWLDAAIDAARRGVKVRIILDASWFNIQDQFDNDEMAAFINRYADADGLPLEARLYQGDRAGITKIHTKGVIVDGNSVLVSSINWNENSPMNNREAGVIIEDPDAAAYYLRVFEEDWKNEYRPAGQTLAIPSEGWPKPAIAMAILLFFAGIILGKRIRKD
jgi:phosphatidylserine/phosphatidylglycerophosphate/cardiolipin synthase-like enzyme